MLLDVLVIIALHDGHEIAPFFDWYRVMIDALGRVFVVVVGHCSRERFMGPCHDL